MLQGWYPPMTRESHKAECPHPRSNLPCSLPRSSMWNHISPSTNRNKTVKKQLPSSLCCTKPSRSWVCQETEWVSNKWVVQYAHFPPLFPFQVSASPNVLNLYYKFLFQYSCHAARRNCLHIHTWKEMLHKTLTTATALVLNLLQLHWFPYLKLKAKRMGFFGWFAVWVFLTRWN